MFDWYKLFNLTEWLATGLVSRNLSLFLEGIGPKEVMITQGNETSITFDDQFLPLKFNDENPYVRGERAIFLDVDDNVWVGFQSK